MSVVTLTFTDEDLDTGRYKAEIEIAGSQIDDGFMTAAHLTGVFIMQHIHSEDFRKRIWAFAAEIAGKPGCSIGNSDQGPSNDIAA